MTEDPQRLRWLQANQPRRRPPRAIKEPVADLVRQLAESGAAVAETADRLALLVDEEFRRHARLASIDAGQLLIQVDRADLVFALRRRWQERIRAALPQLCPRRSMSRVVFAFGTTGTRLVANDKGSGD